MTNLSETLSQRIASSAKAATQYKNWLERNRHLAGADAETIRQDCVRMEDELARLGKATGSRMCVGVFGQSQAGKSYLVSSLASRAGDALAIKAGSNTLQFIGEVNPIESNSESTGIVTRFTVKDSVQEDNFPIELKFLSEMDAAKILADSYFLDVKETGRCKMTVEDIESVLITVSDDVLKQRSDRAFDLKRYLQVHIGTSTFKDYFEHFEPYWPRISSAFEFGVTEERIAVFSLFWGQNEYLTKLFEKMVLVLDALDHPERCWAPISIFSKEANCIIVSTQQAIWDETGISAEVMAENGRRTRVDHAIISALTAEMVAVITDAPSSFYAHADLLDFPGARSRENFDAITTGNLGQLLTRGKVAFLFNRYLDMRELTAMLLCVKDSTQEVSNLPEMVNAWLQVSHGIHSTDRSISDCALFFVLTMADKHFGASDAKMLLEGRITSSIEKFIGSGDNAKSVTEGNVSWLNEWAPGEPFKNTYWLRNTKMPTPGILHKGKKNDADFQEIGIDPAHQAGFDSLQEVASTSGKITRYFKNAGEAWKEMVSIHDGGRSYLLRNIEEVCHPEVKLRQIEREYERFREYLLNLVSKFFADGDAERIFKERMARADQIVSGIRVCAKARKFGEFLSICHICEQDISRVLRAIEREVTSQDDVTISNFHNDDDPFDDLVFGDEQVDAQVASSEDAQEVVEKHLYFAKRLMEEWKNQLGRLKENSRIQEYFHLSEDNLAAIGEEMLKAASRIGLAEKIADTSREASRFPRFAEKLIPHKSRLSAQRLNEFVNQLGFKAGDLTMPDRNNTPVFSRPKVPEGDIPDLPRNPEKRELIGAAHWALAFRTMTAKNTENENGLEDVDLEANTELGSIIETLLPNSTVAG